LDHFFRRRLLRPAAAAVLAAAAVVGAAAEVPALQRLRRRERRLPAPVLSCDAREILWQERASFRAQEWRAEGRVKALVLSAVGTVVRGVESWDQTRAWARDGGSQDGVHEESPGESC
jgi:hypothetical protein